MIKHASEIPKRVFVSVFLKNHAERKGFHILQDPHLILQVRQFGPKFGYLLGFGKGHSPMVHGFGVISDIPWGYHMDIQSAASPILIAVLKNF